MCQFHEPSRLVVGTKQTIRALSEKKVLELYIAEDADQAAGDVKIIYVPTMRELGGKCRIAVGTAVCAVLKQD